MPVCKDGGGIPRSCRCTLRLHLDGLCWLLVCPVIVTLEMPEVTSGLTALTLRKSTIWITIPDDVNREGRLRDRHLHQGASDLSVSRILSAAQLAQKDGDLVGDGYAGRLAVSAGEML